MTARKLGRYLGENAFVITSEGRVKRTAVSALSIKTPEPQIDVSAGSMGRFMSTMEKMVWHPEYQFLNSMEGSGHSFDISEAIEKAKEILRERIENRSFSKQSEAEDRTYLKMLKLGEARQAILEQPLDEHLSVFAPVKGAKNIAETDFPTEYFEPGQKIYALITPKTHYLFSPSWRPHLYFILAEIVKQVSYAPRLPGKLQYRFSQTHYYLSHAHLCATEEEARVRLAEVFNQETEGTIDPAKLRIRDALDERAHREKTTEEIRAQLKSVGYP